MEYFETNGPGNSGSGRVSLSTGWRMELKRLWWLLLYPLAFILAQLAAQNPKIVESVYSNVVFRMISGVVSSIFGVFPFSFAEFLIYSLLALLLAWIIYTIFKAIKKQFDLQKTVHTLITFAIIVGVGMNIFYLFWGFNYFRMPLSYSMKLEVKERPPQELANLCVSLAAAANSLREQLPEDSEGVFTLDTSKEEMLEKIPAGYQILAETYPQYGYSIPAAKPVMASEAMSVAGISGIFIPFTEEANVNVHQPDLLLPAAAAHESAHLLGVAREDEANFLGYLACLSSEDISLKYSGIMLALINAGNALNDISPQAYSELHSYYSPAVLRDLAAHNVYWERYEGQTKEAVERINDNYLKQNGQSDGIISYGRMVDLLLAYYEKLSAQYATQQ